MVQIGDKLVDYNSEFKLFLTTRNPSPDLPPDSHAVITEVNFITTKAGLTGQLLALTIQNEKPELEKRQSELLRKEEELRIELIQLEESLLQELAGAQGNILENKELIESLNKTKQSSSVIQDSLTESRQLQQQLNAERNVYNPLAEFGARLYLVICDLPKINNMYNFSLNCFIKLFQKTLRSSEVRIIAHVNTLCTVKLSETIYEYLYINAVQYIVYCNCC
jgi:dynein heavy chain 2, cytosolic